MWEENYLFFKWSKIHVKISARSFFFRTEILLFVGIYPMTYMGNHTPLENFSLSLKVWNNPHA